MFMVIGIISFVSTVIVFGYDEGMMQNQFLGKIFLVIYQVLKIPMGYVIPIRFIILIFLINDFIWSGFTVLIIHFFSKHK